MIRSRLSRILPAAVALALLPVAAAPAAASPGAGSLLPPAEAVIVSTDDVVPGEILVRYHAGTPVAARAAARAVVGAQLVRRLRVPDTELLRVEEATVPAVVAALRSNPGVRATGPHAIVRAADHIVPNDPFFGIQWGLRNVGQDVGGVSGTPGADIDALEAWHTTTGSPDVVVAVVDSGVAYDHPDLASRMWVNPGEIGSGPGGVDRRWNNVDDDSNGFIDDWRGWDFTEDDNDPWDPNGHGTHVAGTIGAHGNDGYGVTGVAWDVRIMAVRALDEAGIGTGAWIAEAFQYAVDNGAHVVNASLGGPSEMPAVRTVMEDAPDVLFAIAAGNDSANNDATDTYPCNEAVTLPNAVCVAATGLSDELAEFSNFGASTVHLAAPGVRIAGPVGEHQVAHSGTWGLATNPPGTDYQNDTDTWARFQEPVPLSGHTGCTLTYALWLDTELGFDSFLIEASNDGASWALIEGWWGTTGHNFVVFTHDISDYDNEPSFWLRFRLTSDDLLTFQGARIDDVRIDCAGAPGLFVEDFETPIAGRWVTGGTHDFWTRAQDGIHVFMNGTSMATPHVAGVMALLREQSPSAPAAQIIGAMLEGADPVPSLDGVTITGRRLNAAGALAALDPDPSPSPSPSPSPDPEPDSTERVSGPDRFETAIAASQGSFGDWDDPGVLPVAQAVVLARSDDFADALAGTPLAVSEGGPLLLTRPGSLHAATAAEIQRLLPLGSTVYLLGGEAAISNAVRDALVDLGFEVIRVAGANRFGTAIAVGDRIVGDGAPSRILVTTGTDFPDALAAGAVASAQAGSVVVLTRGAVMPTETQNYLAAHAGVPRWAIGGPAAGADPDATPIVGANRFATAQMAADEFFDGPDVVGIASGENFPDALSGGAHIGMRGGPLLLVRAASLPAQTSTYLTGNAGTIATAFVYGGPAAITESVRQAINTAIS